MVVLFVNGDFKKIIKSLKTNKNNLKEILKNQENDSTNYTKWKDNKLIVHALGQFNNTIYTNSYEAMNHSYVVHKMKLMEADFRLTIDKHIVVSHDFSYFHNRVPSFEEFKKAKLRGYLTPMSFKDLVKYMHKNKDLYIITDTKYSHITRVEKEFNEMTKILSRYKDVNKRFIIQIYNEKMYEFLKEKNYPFIHYIFTLYKRMRFPYNLREMESIFQYCKKKGIDAIVMWDYWYNYSYKIAEFSQKYSIPVYVHTVNDPMKIVDFMKRGVKAVFTDNITYVELEEYLNNLDC